MRALSGTAAALHPQRLRAQAGAAAPVACRAAFLGLLVLALAGFSGCGIMAKDRDEAPAPAAQVEAPAGDAASAADDAAEASQSVSDKLAVDDKAAAPDAPDAAVKDDSASGKQPAASTAAADEEEGPDPDALFEALDVTEDYRAGFVHGDKPAKYQRYIVLHDTEGGDSAKNIIDWWDSNGNLVAAHFIVNKDGSIWQCVPLDKIAHHAGYGDTGHNVEFGTNNESRDDKKGTQPIGDWAADYGMNSYSIGIEMVHQGGEGDYPKAQLKAVDALIAYIDAYYGFESQIIDHKAWRSGNSDTSEEFAPYLKSYQQKRTHK